MSIGSKLNKKYKKISHRIKYGVVDALSPFRKNVIESSIERLDFSSRSEALCIFAHFSVDGFIHDYVVNLISEIKAAGSDVIFVSSCGHNFKRHELGKLDGKVVGYVVRENFGYDFGSWKTGVGCYPALQEDYKSVWFCNDSVYGPFSDLRELLDDLKGKADVWSITDSYERTHHFQSYFWGVELNSNSKRFFNDFWFDYFKFRSSRDDVIKCYELTLLDRAVRNFSLTYKAKYPMKEIANRFSVSGKNAIQSINPVHDFACELVTKAKFPFIKRELLAGNPRGNKKLEKMLVFLKDKNVAYGLMCDHHGSSIADAKRRVG